LATSARARRPVGERRHAIPAPTALNKADEQARIS
jgi:hypothetical protein